MCVTSKPACVVRFAVGAGDDDDVAVKITDPDLSVAWSGINVRFLYHLDSKCTSALNGQLGPRNLRRKLSQR